MIAVIRDPRKDPRYFKRLKGKALEAAQAERKLMDERAAAQAKKEEESAFKLELINQARIAAYAGKAGYARHNLLDFVQFTMPDPEDPMDITKSTYEAAKHHKAIAAALEEFEKGTYTQLILTMPPRHGKACAHDTDVLTPQGWRKHGDLRPGDYVFGQDGQPAKILAVSADVDEVVPVTLTNGEVIRCHLNHEWTVWDRAVKCWRTVETRDMARVKVWSGGRARFQLPDTPAVQFPEAALPMRPYALGVWLGDGNASAPRIAFHPNDEAVVREVEALGYPIRDMWVQEGTGVAYATFGGPRPNVCSEFSRALRTLNVHKNKHIPEAYLRSSLEQRLQLLAGLIDTDGHVCRKTGRVRFSTCSEQLRDGVVDLCTTLGFRPYVVRVEPATSSSGIEGRQAVYQVGFQPNLRIPTRLPRKQIVLFGVRRKTAIREIGPSEKAGARSIHVDRPDGLYLVGRTLTPTHNTQLATKHFTAWYMGRNPAHNVAVAAYSDTMANDYGADARAIMNSKQFEMVFPTFKLRRGGAAKDNIQTILGGRAVFVGRGGALTGRGAHLLIIDDIFKDYEEARSETIREQAWNWFTKVAMSRRMGKKLVLIIMTRWHSDDIIGRLTDPENPFYSAKEAQRWKIINLPAIAEDNDPLGRKPGELLWPERFDADFLEQQQTLDPLGFASLYQQRPSVADGTLFQRESIRFYDKAPDDLRIYCSSDHAVSTDQRRDATVLLTVGVDRDDNIYLLDCWWQRQQTDVVVEAMLEILRVRKPLLWFAEKGHISKSIGPFLKKRMLETGVFGNIREMTPAGDKETRAQSIAARTAMGKVFFPRGAFWSEKAVNELLAFPNGNFDDFVDAFAYIGLGLQSQFKAAAPRPSSADPKYGTYGWVKWLGKRQEREAAQKARGGF